jgi:hypothetical protein
MLTRNTGPDYMSMSIYFVYITKAWFYNEIGPVMKTIYFKFSLFVFLLVFFGAVVTNNVSASEGTVEIKSLTNETYKCFAASIQMMDLNYTVLVTCRDLVYPAGEDIFNYVLWINPTNGNKPARLGTLNLGRRTFKTKADFSGMFVTTEGKADTKTPTGPTVMRGDLKKIEFLDTTNIKEPENQGENTEKEEEEIATSPTPSARDRLVTGLKRAAVVSLLALAALIGLVFVLTRKR